MRLYRRMTISQFVRTKFPILTWLPKYNLDSFILDIVAGLAVGFMVIPQSLAVAAIAELSPEYGLYSSFLGDLIYVLLGTCKDITVGPTVLTGLVGNQYNDYNNPDVASAIAFYVGVIIFCLGVFKFGFIINFIPSSVERAFLSTAAVVIAIAQLPFILGLHNVPKHAVMKFVYICKNIHYSNPWDAAMGSCCFLVLSLLHVVAKRDWITQKSSTSSFGIGKKILFFLINGRSAFVALLATSIVYIRSMYTTHTVLTVAGELPVGLPKPKIPVGNIYLTNKQLNSTVVITSQSLLSSVGSGFVVIPLIVVMECLTTARCFSRINSYRVDANQELMAVGAANLFGSFFGSFPISSSCGRAAVKSMSKVASPISGIVSSVLVVLTLEVLTPFFRFTPMATLGAIVLTAAMTLIDPKLPFELWKCNKVDFFLAIVTISGTFYSLEFGVIAGCFCGILIIVYKSAKPGIGYSFMNKRQELVISVKGSLWYSGVEGLGEQILRTLEKETSCRTVKLNCKHIYEMDYTVARCLKQLALDLRMKDVKLNFICIDSDHVFNILSKLGLVEDTVEIGDCSKTDARQASINYERAENVNLPDICSYSFASFS